MRVNIGISDIFFNLDHSEANMADKKGNFAGYNAQKLLEQAQWLVDALSLFTSNVPTATDIVADFNARL
jgi:hypothetical protein